MSSQWKYGKDEKQDKEMAKTVRGYGLLLPYEQISLFPFSIGCYQVPEFENEFISLTQSNSIDYIKI